MVFFRGKIKSVRIAIPHPVRWEKQHSRGAVIMASDEKLVAARKLIFRSEFMFSYVRP